LLVRQVL